MSALPLVLLPVPARAATAAPERVTVSLAGGEPDGPSGPSGNDGADGIAVSADGRCVAFQPAAFDLAPGDTNAKATSTCGTGSTAPPPG